MTGYTSMNKLLLTLTAVAAIGLAACEQKGTTSVAASTSSAASAITDAAASANAVQTLTSSDSKISLSIQGSQFADAMQNKDLLPDGLAATDLTLLQHDPASEITVYVANLGKPKSPAADYFNKLKAALEKDSSLSNVEAGVATENRMSYRFSQKDKEDNTLNENCLAVYEADNIYNICANSYSASSEQLNEVLKDVKLVK